MAPFVSSIEIARPPDEVFAYVTDPSTFSEWQAGVDAAQYAQAKSAVLAGLAKRGTPSSHVALARRSECPWRRTEVRLRRALIAAPLAG